MPEQAAQQDLVLGYRHSGDGRQQVTRWWKCDLQVATPGARNFRGPSDRPWVIDTDTSRAAAAERYMEAVQAAGVEVIALADHNDASWIATMTAAGEAAGVAVFPGVEVTTGSGADGIHLIIIGERGRTTADFDDVLSRVCGFGGDHPRFNEAKAAHRLQHLAL